MKIGWVYYGNNTVEQFKMGDYVVDICYDENAEKPLTNVYLEGCLYGKSDRRHDWEGVAGNAAEELGHWNERDGKWYINRDVYANNYVFEVGIYKHSAITLHIGERITKGGFEYIPDLLFVVPKCDAKSAIGCRDTNMRVADILVELESALEYECEQLTYWINGDIYEVRIYDENATLVGCACGFSGPDKLEDAISYAEDAIENGGVWSVNA